MPVPRDAKLCFHKLWKSIGSRQHGNVDFGLFNPVLECFISRRQDSLKRTREPGVHLHLDSRKNPENRSHEDGKQRNRYGDHAHFKCTFPILCASPKNTSPPRLESTPPPTKDR